MLNKKIKHTFYILLSIALSWFIAISVDLEALELGAIINFIYPIIIGLLSLVIYLVGTWILKRDKWKIVFLIVAILINTGTGLFIRFVDF